MESDAMSEMSKSQSKTAASLGRMILALGLLSAFCGLLVVGASQIAAPFIKANREALIDAAVNSVTPGGARKEIFGYAADGVYANPEGVLFGERFYAVYDSAGVLNGLALEVTARGDGGAANIIYGYDPNRKEVTGAYVVESRETPGRGYRIGAWPGLNEADRSVESRGFAVMLDRAVQQTLPRVLPFLDTLRKARP